MNIYDFWQRHISKSYFLFKDILSEHLNIKKEDSVLDYGCGTGKYCLFFNPKKYLGIDVSKKNIRIARKKFKKYKFLQIEKNKINLKDKSFDFILVLGVFHHISDNDMDITLRELKRVLEDKGKIMVIEPILSKTSTRLNRWMKFIDRGKYFRFEIDLICLLNKYFKVKEVNQFITELFYNEKIYELTKKQKN